MRLFLLANAVFLFSCSALHKGQAENVKAFSRSAKALAAVPGELYSNISDYRHELKLIESSTIYSPDKIIAHLNKNAAIKKQFEKNSEIVNHSALLIESYAECLLALTDESYKQFEKQTGDLSLKLNAAVLAYNQGFNKRVPLNIGNFIGGVVRQVGSVELKHLQKKYLKNFVDSGTQIINTVCDYFITTMGPSLENELVVLDRDFTNTMTTFYNNVYAYQSAQNVNPFDYLKYYNPLYLEMKERLEGLHELQQKTVASMQHIKMAHEKLRTVAYDKKVKDIAPEIKELYIAIIDVQAAHKRLKQ